MHALLFVLLVAADPTDEQASLLKTFRSEFVAIAPGEGKFPAAFRMGNSDGGAAEQSVHEVTLKRPFAVAAYEVPQNLWQAVMGSNPSRWKGPRNSVEMITRDEAMEFCRRTTRLMREAKLIEQNQVIRLPSEAEWEHAARAGTKTAYSFGDDPDELGRYAWFHGNAAGNDPAVGEKAPNPWKLFDVHGYLWEWCADDWHDTYANAPPDGSAWGDGSAEHGVLRGGSWKDPAERLTSSHRRQADKNLRDDAVGFRCVLAEERLE